MTRSLPALLGAVLLAGCASAPMIGPGVARDAVRDFAIEARFALRYTEPGKDAQSSNGRLSWSHRRDQGNRILLASPLGNGIAEIETRNGMATLQTSDGTIYHSTDADTLVEDVTGQRLPVTRLPAWLVGRAANGARLDKDSAGRPAKLAEDGWRIDYGYDDLAPDSLPSRLTVTRDSEIELRLRIEEWRKEP